jgi:hypothetical protein
MDAAAFADYYEIPEISPGANRDTIKWSFRNLAQAATATIGRPETAPASTVVGARNTLKDPVGRAVRQMSSRDVEELVGPDMIRVLMRVDDALGHRRPDMAEHLDHLPRMRQVRLRTNHRAAASADEPGVGVEGFNHRCFRGGCPPAMISGHPGSGETSGEATCATDHCKRSTTAVREGRVAAIIALS